MLDYIYTYGFKALHNLKSVVGISVPHVSTLRFDVSSLLFHDVTKLVLGVTQIINSVEKLQCYKKSSINKQFHFLIFFL